MTATDRPQPPVPRRASEAAVGMVERVLRSPWRLAIVVAALVAVLSWLGADLQRRVLEARLRGDDAEVRLASLFVPEFVHLATWALVTPALLAAFLWTWQKLHPALFAVSQLCLCVGVAWGMGWMEHHTTDHLREWTGPFVVEGDRDGAAGPDEVEAERRERAQDDEWRVGGERRRERYGREGLDAVPPPQDPAGLGPGPGPPRGRGPWDRSGRLERMYARGLAPSASVNASRRLPREVLFYLLALGLAGSGFAFLQQRKAERRRTELELEAAALGSELARTQLRSLRAQLQPHFLFNALHGIGGLVREGRDREALRTLSDLGGLLRRTLDADRAERWPLARELELVDEYLSVEGVRLGERLTVERSVDEGARGLPLPPLLLLPLVENAIRHGVAVRPGRGRLWIAAERAGDRLRVVVEDDGPGFPPGVLAAGRHPAQDETHVGLFNTGERLARLFPGRHRFELSNRAEGGARVTIELPVEESLS